MMKNHTHCSQVNPQVFGEGKLGVEKMKMELSRWINFDELNGSRVPLVEEGPRAQLGDDEKDLKDLLGSEEEETHLKGRVQPAQHRQSVCEKSKYGREDKAPS